MVVHKQNNGPDHDCISYFNLRRAQDGNLVFHESSSDAIILYDNMSESALDKVVASASEVSFERKTPTSIKPEVTPGDRFDLRISGQPEEPYTLHERSKIISHFQFDETRLAVSKQIGDKKRFDQELFAGKCSKSRSLSCITSRF